MNILGANSELGKFVCYDNIQIFWHFHKIQKISYLVIKVNLNLPLQKFNYSVPWVKLSV